MSEMVERVAKALMSVDNAHPGQDHWPDEWEERAHAVIEAMREPTAAMTWAGSQESSYDDLQLGTDHMADIWRAMIDAALK